MKKSLITVIASSLLLTFAAQGQITTIFLGNVGGNGDRLNRAANWDNGLPLIADEKEGTVSTATWAAATTAALVNDTVNGWNLTQIDGRVYADANRNFGGGTIWNLQGGELDFQTFTLNTASLSGYTLNMSGGTFTAGRMNAYDETVLNLSGGSMTVTRAVWQGGQINFLAGNAVVNVTGGTVGTDFQTNTNTVIDFSPLATGTLTITTIDGLTGFESLWTQNRLRFNGANSGSFSDHFQVSGNTLAVVPEPSTYAALLGALALGLVAWRRRKLA